MQETLTTVYSRWARVQRAGNVDAYVHRIPTRTSTSEWRRGWWKVRLAGAATANEQYDAHLPDIDLTLESVH